LTRSSRLLGPCVVDNLSVGGLQLTCGEGLRRGQRLTLLLDLPGRGGVSITAQVRRHSRSASGEHVIGLAFDELPPALREHFEALVASQLLAAFPSIEFFCTDQDGTRQRLLLGDSPMLVEDSRFRPL
jgi:hypothetical protein